MTALCGLLAVCKPPGPSSQQVVAAIRRMAGGGLKVGHAGTLDPEAAGVLPVCLGPATRLADYLHLPPKEYRFELVLGAATDTQDATGQVIGEAGAEHLDGEAVASALGGFVGTIRQRPPLFSARHVGGRRLYAYAREGRAVEAEERAVRIDELRLLAWRPGRRARALCALVCGSGTYVRALCAALGEALGTGGHMGALVRHRAGGLGGWECRTLEEIGGAAQDGTLRAALRSPAEALGFLPAVALGAAEGLAASRGRAPDPRPAAPGDGDGPVRLLDGSGALLAVAARQVLAGTARFALERVLPAPAGGN